MIFLGEKLTKLRNKKGLSMQDLEKITGVRQSNISDLENNKTPNPRESTVTKLSKGLGVKPMYFYISNKDLCSFFPHLDEDLIDFILNSDSIPYIEAVMELKKNDISAEKAEMYIDLMLRLKQLPENN